MPIEIKELIIKTTISESQDKINGGNGTTGEGTGYSQDHIVRQCVKQVLEIIKSKQER